ncbi:MAG: hypothetical protein CMB31_04355, partial [Euryarchaeota archaeon]|nr:hypothetical protein [Euryarchaeota archaeon]
MAIPTMLRLGDLVIQLIVVRDDIDEDDRDAIQVQTLVQNPTKNNLKAPKLNIKTSGARVQIFKSLSTNIIAKGQDDALHFLPKKPGAWILTAEHLGKQGELGPFPGDYRMEVNIEEITIESENSQDLLSDAFENALSGFGIEDSFSNQININEENDPLAAAFAHGISNSPPSPPTPIENQIGSNSENPMTGPPQGPQMTGPPQGPPMTGPPQGPQMT